MNRDKKQIILNYIDRVEKAISDDSFILQHDYDLFDLLIEISNVFQSEIPEIKNSLFIRNGTEIRDANTTISLLKIYLVNNGVSLPCNERQEDILIRRFWTAFKLWFENELINIDLLKDIYLGWDNWNGGHYWLNLDYNYEFQLYRGIDYPDSLKQDSPSYEEIKAFIEIAYKHWIKNDAQSHYNFTVKVNEQLNIFKLPYRLQNGLLIKQGYKTTFAIDRILNYRMFERKIKFSEQMISSGDMMEKKSALDFLIDSLQYLVSTQEGNRVKQYSALAKMINSDINTKVYSVVKYELQELMKLSNEYFDIRHNDYLNDAREHREALNDSQFIEYLYNRAYSLLYLLRLKYTY